MQEAEYFLTQLSSITGIDIFIYNDDGIRELGVRGRENPLKGGGQLCRILISQTVAQKLPLLYEDSHHVLWLCVCTGENLILLGPAALDLLDTVDLYHYFREYRMEQSENVRIPVLSLKRIIALLQLITYELCGYKFSEKDFLRANGILEMAGWQDNHDLPRFQTAEDIEEKYHHTYQEERKLLDCVREGRVDDALKYNMDIDTCTGRLSKKELSHWKKVVIVAVTLCTRAAIEGGVSPAAAYQLSDYYIQKCDQYDTISTLIACRNEMVKTLAKQVQKKKENNRGSNYIDRCKDYISKHYKEKIYLDDIAKALGLSSTYLSRLFSRECGIRLQEYIDWFRVERASNLLIYSEESISHIAGYVNFPSQSYLGKMFKKYKGMTPGEYRNKNKPAEFVTGKIGQNKDNKDKIKI